jgi:hypothetical protein
MNKHLLFNIFDVIIVLIRANTNACTKNTKSSNTDVGEITLLVEDLILSFYQLFMRILPLSNRCCKNESFLKKIPYIK